MKKAITILMFVLMMSSLMLIACNGGDAQATSIKVVNPQTAYVVGQSIDYDKLLVEITYSDGTTKQDTIANLHLQVEKQADLTVEGQTSYIIAYGPLTFEVKLTVENYKPQVVAAELPEFYVNYQTNSAPLGEGKTEGRGDFRISGQTYEVGNVNKFIFRPTLTAFNDEGQRITITNPKTVAKVYQKIDDQYKLVEDQDLESLVAISENTYKFTEEAAGKTFKVEISFDQKAYDLSDLTDQFKTISFECLVVGGGYNVYDQMGLSVVNDLNSARYVDVWKCDIDGNFNLIAREDSLKLEADDKPLCEYVGNIDWAILHGSIKLNADLMPDSYFWTEDTEGYPTAYDYLASLPEWQSTLVGTLRDGTANGEWWRVMNMKPNSHEGYALNYIPNMQKSFFGTTKVSISGNYNSITVPTERSEGGRLLASYVGYDSNEKVSAPTPHWSVFQMYQPNKEIPTNFQFKNFAAKGNCPQVDGVDAVPAGAMFLVTFSNGLVVDNVITNDFFTNINCDSYGVTNVTLQDSKFYNAYSNMFYIWRSNVNIINSELIGSGGPLFILSDGTNTDSTKLGKEFGPNLTADDKSVLQAFATGEETWYTQYNAQALVMTIKGQIETGVLNNLKKTVRFVRDTNGNMVPYTDGASSPENQYVNVIAAMICSPSSLFDGKLDDAGENGQPKHGTIYVRGSYSTKKADGTVVESFEMDNPYVTGLRAAQGNDGRQLPLIVQTGDLFCFTDTKNLYTLGATGKQPFNPATDGVKWAMDNHDRLAIYMSASSGNPQGSQYSPYFGVILAQAKYGM